MSSYVGLDVSLKAVSICVMDGDGRVLCAELAMVWRSGADAGRPGRNGSRVGESIVATGTSQNQSRGSDSLVS